MDQVTVTVKGKKYPVRFGYRALRQLGIIWQLDSPTKVGDRIAKAFEGVEENGEVGFKQIDTVGEMVYSAIVANDPTASEEIEPGDCSEEMISRPDEFMKVIEAYGSALPQPDKPVGKPKKVTGKGRKK